MTAAIICTLAGPRLSAVDHPGHSSGRFTDRASLTPQFVVSIGAEGALHLTTGSGSPIDWTLVPTTLARAPAAQPRGSAVPDEKLDRFDQPGISVWYSRAGSRVEQGFKLDRRPGGSGHRVTIGIATSGNLLPVPESPTDISLRGGRAGPNLRYSGLKVTDKHGRMLPAWLGVSGTTIDVSFQDRSAAYPVTIDPWIEQGSLVPPAGSNTFGAVLSSSSTGSTVLVGDPQGGSSGGGDAAVYSYDGSAWTGGTPLVPPPGSVAFGSSVALSADGTTALVGDPESYDRASETGGSATVYTLGPEGWSTETELDPPSSALSFGTSVALSGNGLTAIVGDEQGGVSGTGAATVYTLDGTSWSPSATLNPPSGTSAFGKSVALSAAGSTALVGDPGASGGGTATAYTLSGESWGSGAPLPVPAHSSAFGSTLSLNQNGTEALVGDPTGGALGAGAAAVFAETGSSWTSGTPLSAPDSDSDFGDSVALSATGESAIVGAPGTLGGGAATAYQDSGTWSSVALPNPPSLGAAFGWSVALSGPGLTAIVGDPVGGPCCGSVVVFTSPAPTMTTLNLSPSSVASGNSVTYSADVASTAGVPTGSVGLSVGSTQLCTANLVGGVASCNASNAPIGADIVVGDYSGDLNFSASSATASLNVGPPSSQAANPAPSAAYDLVGSDGGVFVFGGSGQGFFGSLPGLGVHVHDIVGIVPTATDAGYFLVGSDGGVFAFGNAPFENSLPGLGVHVNNIVGIVPTSDNFGYWLVSATGAVYALGDAPYVGGLGGRASEPIVGIASTHDSKGYWLVGENGSVFAFGNAQFYGSLPDLGVAVSNIVAVVPTPDGQGYWLIGSDGGVFAFGDASEVSSLPELGVKVDDIVGAVPAP